MKNPLNFVVNFTEANLELCLELREQMPDSCDEVVSEIEHNLNHVLHHANRAFAVMYTMLQVCRSRTCDDLLPCRMNHVAEQSTKLAEKSCRMYLSDLTSALTSNSTMMIPSCCVSSVT